MRVLIAAQASLLLLNLPDDCYRHVGTIIVHPTTVVLRGERSAGTGGLMTDAPFAIDGQAHFHGPILLAWDAVQRDARFPGRGLNVVFHEFAHQLDMLDGLLDGTPPQADEQAKSRWIDVFTRSYRAMCDTDVPSILREYATTNPAEYFAVATEMFWTRPTDFAQEMPEVFAVMKGFFRFDPAA